MGTQERSIAIRLLRADPRRDVYEGAGPGGKHGCGLHWITYTGDEKPYTPLTKADIAELLREGVIVPGEVEGMFKRGPALAT